MFSSSAVLDVSVMVPVFVAGLVLTLSLVVVIGAQNTYVLRQGLRREHVALVVVVCVALDAALMALGISGLAAFLVRNPVLLRAVACLGAAALAWYAWQALGRALQPQALQAQAQGQRQAPRQVLAQVLGISLLNPHVYLDTVLLIGAMGAQQPPGAQGVFWLGATSASALWFLGLGFGARWLAPVFARPQAWRVLDLSVAVMMGWLAWGLLRQGWSG
ncbi:LysE/ArgO family amino acid transporter [Acidovorax temperans]|uniref:LysE/ArgO family amino acid transporter n=1 Tax=Acidovorax temperans TaxID=80878 RepID=UPI0035B33876